MPDPSELIELARIAGEAVNRASEMLRTGDPGDIVMKGDRDPATEVDYAIERATRDFLLFEVPEISFLGEEDGQMGPSTSGMYWALDPIDGTVNFIHGLPLCGVSLGLIADSEPVLGVIELPFQGLRYTATQGQGAYRAGQRLRTSRVLNLRDAVVALGDYAVGDNAEFKNAQRFEVTRRLATQAERVRMFGAASVDLAWVAEGRIDGSVTLSNKAWDVAAGMILVKEAGGRIMDLSGSDHTLEATATIASAPGIATELIEAIRGI